jgi:hypothetical protein
MKKIGIITVSRTYNFGAELQAFALQYKLNKAGYKAEVIDYLYFKNKRHKTTVGSKPELYFSKKAKTRSKLKYQFVVPIIDTLLPFLHKKTKIRDSNFRLFHQRYTHFSKEFRTIESLYKAKHEYDVVISGSDQVWNPATFSSLKPYLLDFVPQATKRITYAASFGVAEVSEEFKHIYSYLFKKLDCIGVREESGKNLIHQIAKRDASIVLDPTLLLNKDDWREVTKELKIGIQKPYILIYDLHSSEPLIDITNKLQKQLNLPVYRLCKRTFINKKNEGIINIEDAGPSEFIYLFLNATYVITNSFHGTVFSANFNIPFKVVLNPERNNNSRITGFLQTIGLSDCIIWENDNHNNFKTNVDFVTANNVLDNLRNESILFLEKAIN